MRPVTFIFCAPPPFMNPSNLSNGITASGPRPSPIIANVGPVTIPPSAIIGMFVSAVFANEPFTAPANAADKLFIALNGTAVVYHDNSAATQMTGWNRWVIDLQAFADQGLNLANVSTITIGIGTKNSPAAGGPGTMYFDDIRLYR